jgi:uncharacterized membrane protein (DUF2068 family)
MQPTVRTDTAHPKVQRDALRAIAMFEAIKGCAAAAALLGVLDLARHDVRHLAIELIGRFGLHADDRYPSLLLHYAELLPDANLRALTLLGIGYIALRFIEAYGLWRDRSWGELFGALSGALYIPFEVRHLMHRPSLISFAVFALNVSLVIYLLVVLMRRRRLQQQALAR